ncbi:MAG: TraB/GumN family protein [Gammaproteobacteria bacterium]|nr:TraB/GumN family protein [Gammaproteobacteria bacterium]
MSKYGIALLLAWVLAPWLGGAQAEQTNTPLQAGADQGLLWRIEKPGVAPSHLLGTLHSEDPRIVALPEPVSHALHSADRVTLEVILDPNSLAAMSGVMQIVEGPELPALLGEALYRKTVQAMATQGVPEQSLRTLKPWAVAMTLMVPKTNTGLFLDRVLYLEALAKGKPIAGLETVAEQIEVFDGLSRDDQVALVAESLRSFPKLDTLYAELRAAYVRRDLRAIAALNDTAMREGDPGLAQRFSARAITDRNARMVERMQPGLQQGNTFFAVGALHLPGETGILQALRRQGYTVTAVY